MNARLLVHATLTITGLGEAQTACDEQIKTLLMHEVFAGSFEERHGPGGLSYDFKLHGGIPFPAFALASQNFPAAVITAEWVNPAAARKGRACIRDGKITEHVEEALTMAATDLPNRYLAANSDGRLRLAMVFEAEEAQGWTGYVVTADRDASFMLSGTPSQWLLRVTEGAPEWARSWRLDAADASPLAVPMNPVQAVAPDLWQRMEDRARAFADEWLWFRDDDPERVAIDRDRFRRYGFAEADANIKAARLYAMQAAAAPGSRLQHSTVAEDRAWIVDVLQRCWLDDPSGGPQ